MESRHAGNVSGPSAITWIGHATVLIEIDGARLLTDPVLGRRAGPLVRVAPPVAADAHAGVDAVLLSHLHADHADLPSLRRLGRATPVLAPRGAERWLRLRGFDEVRELVSGEAVEVAGLTVTGVPAVHEGRRWPVGGAQAEAIGFVVRASRSCYFAGDTDLYPDMSDLAGSIDVALLPVWGWGRTVGAGHLDPERAAQAAGWIAPRIAVPIHWGTLAPPRPLPRVEDPVQHAREFAALAAKHAPGVEVRILEPGERTELP
jgi:L-ascorbate metabolism protein UlaG (beta-lactamase superfamily)